MSVIFFLPGKQSRDFCFFILFYFASILKIRVSQEVPSSGIRQPTTFVKSKNETHWAFGLLFYFVLCFCPGLQHDSHVIFQYFSAWTIYVSHVLSPENSNFQEHQIRKLCCAQNVWAHRKMYVLSRSSSWLTRSTKFCSPFLISPNFRTLTFHFRFFILHEIERWHPSGGNE